MILYYNYFTGEGVFCQVLFQVNHYNFLSFLELGIKIKYTMMIKIYTGRTGGLIFMPDQKNETNQIGSRIRELRKERGLTIAALAKQVDITKGYLSNLERGAVDNPTIKVLTQIAESLNVDRTKILEPSEEDDESGIYYGYHNIFEELNGEKDKDERKFRQAVTAVGDILSDKSIPPEKRKEVAEEIISLTERIESWLK